MTRYPSVIMNYINYLSDQRSFFPLWEKVLTVIDCLYCAGKEVPAIQFLDSMVDAMHSGKLSPTVRPTRELLANVLDALFAKSQANDIQARLLFVRLIQYNGADPRFTYFFELTKLWQRASRLVHQCF